jgi:acetylornithine aminotransferase
LKGGLEARAILSSMRERGVLLIIAGDSALRICPPLVVTDAELEQGVTILDEVLGSLRQKVGEGVAGVRA